MDRPAVPRNQGNLSRLYSRAGTFLVALICWSLPAAAQNASQRQNASKPFITPATHLVGFENAKSNHRGTLSIQGDSLQFQRTGKSGEQIKISSVRDIFLGEESRPVGGLPLTIGEAAAPYGGGRVVSLFAHKKYDTLTLEYVDADGGIHGAIFQLTKGHGELLENDLIAHGATISSRKDQSKKESAAEAVHENR